MLRDSVVASGRHGLGIFVATCPWVIILGLNRHGPVDGLCFHPHRIAAVRIQLHVVVSVGPWILEGLKWNIPSGWNFLISRLVYFSGESYRKSPPALAVPVENCIQLILGRSRGAGQILGKI